VTRERDKDDSARLGEVTPRGALPSHDEQVQAHVVICAPFRAETRPLSILMFMRACRAKRRP
jgi:hypothetical protein